MKELITIIILILFFGVFVSAQPCLPDGITFTSQGEIDDFQTNYPNCTEIGNDVIIAPELFQEIHDLSGLDVITSIGGDLVIINTSVESFEGLNNLNIVEGSLTIINNYYLEDITGLNNLSLLDSNLLIQNNTSLLSLEGLGNIIADSIENLTITDNSSLIYCETESICSYLENPGGSVTIYRNGDGCSNPPDVTSSCGFTLNCLPYGNYYFFSQTEIENFPGDYLNCNELSGTIQIRGDEITNLDSLYVINFIYGDFDIFQNNDLVSIEGLKNIDLINGILSIRFNKSLTSLSGLDSLKFVKDIRIVSNDSLNNISSLEAITYIENTFEIISNHNLSGLNGLNNLDSIGWTLMIANNSKLLNLNGLNSLISVGFFLYITNNSSLENLIGLDNIVFGNNVNISNNPTLNSIVGLGNLKSVGDLKIYGNDSLLNFNGLDSLKSIDGDLFVYGNDLIQNLEGFEDINAIGGELTLGVNQELISIAELENLSEIGGDLIIYSNNKLTSLLGLQNINAGSITGLYLRENDELFTCDVKSICDYLADPNGIIKIEYNRNGCNSQEEVEEACILGESSLIFINSQISIYPNPATNQISISSNNTTIKEVSVYNQFGQKVLSQKQPINRIDVSSLNQGIYVIELVTMKSRLKRKLVIK